MNDPVGLRELKKRRTREEIAAVAHRLFAASGFEAVTVAEVARVAEVSQKTVFNYFPTKEDLFYNRADSFGAELLAAVRDRSPGTTVIEAFKRFVLVPRGLLALADDSSEGVKRQTTLLRVALESPALLAREKEVLDRYSRSLAKVIGQEIGATEDDVEPRVVADALMAVHRALIDHVRPRLAAGEPGQELLKDFRRQGRRAFARLEKGLDGYARR
jgi:AcrR family transcriptional regulator